MIVFQDNSNITHKKNKNFRKIVVIISIICASILLVAGAGILIKFLFIDSSSVKQMKDSWAQYKYEDVYKTSHDILQSENFNNQALTYNGYAAFYLAVSQLDSASAQNYLDESINDLRIALFDAPDKLKPQINYMLGKAYFYKNAPGSYYYSDLSVKYLTEAKKLGYKAEDLSEYLGLSQAALGNTNESISEFSEALLTRQSDFILLSIAQQYIKSGQRKTAEQYLFMVIKNNQNEELVLKCRNELGNIYIEDKKYTEAKNEFEEILKINPNSADAYYGLGLIYEKQGDLVKARAEWRKALKAQVNHPGALSKISETR